MSKGSEGIWQMRREVLKGDDLIERTIEFLISQSASTNMEGKNSALNLTNAREPRLKNDCFFFRNFPCI